MDDANNTKCAWLVHLHYTASSDSHTRSISVVWEDSGSSATYTFISLTHSTCVVMGCPRGVRNFIVSSFLRNVPTSFSLLEFSSFFWLKTQRVYWTEVSQVSADNIVLDWLRFRLMKETRMDWLGCPGMPQAMSIKRDTLGCCCYPPPPALRWNYLGQLSTVQFKIEIGSKVVHHRRWESTCKEDVVVVDKSRLLRWSRRELVLASTSKRGQELGEVEGAVGRLHVGLGLDLRILLQIQTLSYLSEYYG